MKAYNLKVSPIDFDSHFYNEKSWELCPNDEYISVGDILIFNEYKDGKYTGGKIINIITSVCISSFNDAYLILSIRPMTLIERFVYLLNRKKSRPLIRAVRDVNYAEL